MKPAIPITSPTTLHTFRTHCHPTLRKEHEQKAVHLNTREQEGRQL